MGVFVCLPLVLPLTALPIARLAGQHLHPRSATRLLAAVGTLLALCSTLCLGLLMVVGTAQLPGNPLPDGWSDPEVRDAVPYEVKAGIVAIGALAAVVGTCGWTVYRHVRLRIRAGRALAAASAVTSGDVAVLPDPEPYAYALPGDPGRVVVSTAMIRCLDARERRALVAHERAHLAARHHRYLLAAHLAARANPFLMPLRTAVAFSTERWADEEAARAVGDRRVVAVAVGKAALFSHRAPDASVGFAAFAAASEFDSAAGPVPRRVAALLAPVPQARLWPPSSSHAALAALVATAGTAVSAFSSLNAAVTLVRILHAATPL
ncbi:M56 family metallopeptidase [Streptomyces sp. NBC_01217]|uniref:M56 family metallopeptidase n=1 Tax=Streptomyces sp. NBC_01217 TaxID=2903779 RepID=UPI002E10179C|nr:M56 family metallopeptidase [Streptomyces sp. NBC_01217]